LRTIGSALLDSYWAKSSASTKQTSLVKVLFLCEDVAAGYRGTVGADSDAGLGAGKPGIRLSIPVDRIILQRVLADGQGPR
jgi:hypothetical protein